LTAKKYGVLYLFHFLVPSLCVHFSLAGRKGLVSA
jgi:hypothetical protein